MRLWVLAQPCEAVHNLPEHEAGVRVELEELRDAWMDKSAGHTLMPWDMPDKASWLEHGVLVDNAVAVAVVVPALVRGPKRRRDAVARCVARSSSCVGGCGPTGSGACTEWPCHGS